MSFFVKFILILYLTDCTIFGEQIVLKHNGFRYKYDTDSDPISKSPRGVSTIFNGTQDVAIKIGTDAKRSAAEAEVYVALSKKGFHDALPTFHRYIDEYKVLIIELLGPTLFEIYTKSGKFPIKTVMQVGIQLLSALERLHEIGKIHGDVSIRKCAIGQPNNSNHTRFVLFGFEEMYNLDNKDKKNADIEGVFGCMKYLSMGMIYRHLKTERIPRNNEFKQVFEDFEKGVKSEASIAQLKGILQKKLEDPNIDINNEDSIFMSIYRIE